MSACNREEVLRCGMIVTCGFDLIQEPDSIFLHLSKTFSPFDVLIPSTVRNKELKKQETLEVSKKKVRNSKSPAHIAEKSWEGSYVMSGPNFWIYTCSAIFRTTFPKGRNDGG